MMEQPQAGEGHDHAVFVRRFDHMIVPDGAARLHDVGNAALSGPLHIVPEGEEGVGTHGDAGLGGDPGFLFLSCQGLGLYLEGLLPYALLEDVLVFIGEVNIDGVVPVGAADLVHELQGQGLGMLAEIPKDADGQFFVGIIESEQEKHLDRRWKRSIQFEVLYFLNTKENMEFNAWAETMFDQFDVLTVKETDQKDRTVRLTGQKATPNKNARVFQFTFDADFFFVVTPPEIPFMENLDQTEEVK